MSGTYLSREASQHDGQPLEAYKFVGTFREYRYTSNDTTVVVAGQTYDPIPIKRNAIKAGTSGEDGLDLELKVPVDIALVQDYALGIAPPNLKLTVYRAHRGTDLSADYAVYWTGPVAGINLDGRDARIIVPSIFGRLLAGEIPSVYYQNPCNHALFDERCKLSRASYTVSTTVTDISGTSINLLANGGHPDSFFVGGELVTAAGERRMVIQHVAKTVVVNFPFARLAAGDSVSVTAGCDHSGETCKNKFNNRRNYGGFLYIPSVNPFTEGL